MIGFFPDPYEDELVYSWIARYYMRSGLSQHIQIAKQLFAKTSDVPTIEFINMLTDEARRIVFSIKPVERIVLDHTMFPHYARFLPKEKKVQAFQSLLAMGSGYNNILTLPNIRTAEPRWLRYCPECAKEDRAKLGECYWHRTHQIVGVSICPLHRCRLENTQIPMNRNVSPALFPAEITVPENTSLSFGCEIDIEVSRYLVEVFQSPFHIDREMPISRFFSDHLVGTQYLSVRGEHRYTAKILQDFNDYYLSLSIPHISEQSQMQKLLDGVRFNPFEICLLSNFLKIQPVTLAKMVVSPYRHEDLYDAMILDLHSQGKNYAEIARMIGGSYDTVKAIGEGNYKKYNKGRRKGKKTGPRIKYTPDYDKAMLVKVKSAIKEVLSEDRPRRITPGMIARIMGLPDKSIDSMPLCKAEIEKYKETQEEYWLRELEWAINRIRQEEKAPTKTAVMSLTNLSRVDIVRCLEKAETKAACPVQDLLYRLFWLQ